MEFSLQADVELGEGGMYNIDAKIVQVEVEEDVEESWIPEESVELGESVGLPDEVADGVIQTGGLKRNATDKEILLAIKIEMKNLKFKPPAIAYYMKSKDFKMDTVSEIKSRLKESVEHLDEWGIPADQDAYYAANKKKWEKEGDAKTRKQWKDAMKKMKKKKKKK
jgi:hypothetical protein